MTMRITTQMYSRLLAAVVASGLLLALPVDSSAAETSYLQGIDDKAQDSFRKGLAAALKKVPKCNPYRLLAQGGCCPPGFVSLGKTCARVSPSTCASVAIDNPKACLLTQCAKYVQAKGKMVDKIDKKTKKPVCKTDDEGKEILQKDAEGNDVEGKCEIEQIEQEVPCTPWNNGQRDLNCLLDTYECTKAELNSGPARWCGDWTKKIVVPPQPGPDGEPVKGAVEVTKYFRCKPTDEGCELNLRECSGKELLENKGDGAGPCKVGQYMHAKTGACTDFKCPAHCTTADGRCAQCGPDYLGAAQHFEKAINIDERFYEAYFNWAMSLERLGRYDKALEVYEKARQVPPKSERDRKAQLSAQGYVARHKLGEAARLREAGETAKAKTLSRQARGICESIRGHDPDNTIANNTLAQYWLDGNNFDLAEKFIRQVLRVNREDTIALNIRGLIQLRKKSNEISRWILEEKVLALDPANPEAFANLGLAYVRLKDLPRAVVAFERAVKLKPNSVAARLNLGAIYIEYLNYKGADTQYGAALKLEPDNLEALTGHALALEGLRKPGKAEKLYQRVLAKDPTRKPLLVRLALIYEKAPFNDGNKAVVYWKRYRKAVGLPVGEAAKAQRLATKAALEAHKKKRTPRKKKKKGPFLEERARLTAAADKAFLVYKNVLAIDSRIFAIVEGMKMQKEARDAEKKEGG